MSPKQSCWYRDSNGFIAYLASLNILSGLRTAACSAGIVLSALLLGYLHDSHVKKKFRMMDLRDDTLWNRFSRSHWFPWAG